MVKRKQNCFGHEESISLGQKLVARNKKEGEKLQFLAYLH